MPRPAILLARPPNFKPWEPLWPLLLQILMCQSFMAQTRRKSRSLLQFSYSRRDFELNLAGQRRARLSQKCHGALPRSKGVRWPDCRQARAAAEAAPRKAKLPLPDPKSQGPFQPFTCDPGRSEAWWWLGIPIAAALFIVGSYAIDPDWNGRWMTGESGILETAQFIFMVDRPRHRRATPLLSLRAPTSVGACRDRCGGAGLPLHRRRGGELGPAHLLLARPEPRHRGQRTKGSSAFTT